MKILILSNNFDPFVEGGAEIAAHNLAKWLQQQGHTVGVLTVARGHLLPEESLPEVSTENGLRIYRKHFPNVYDGFYYAKAHPLLKPLWHLHDQFNLWTNATVRQVVEDFQPDIVNVHNIQGMGYNVLRTLGALNLPVLLTLHDLGLLCLNKEMFRHGKECVKQEWFCRITSKIKLSHLHKIQRIGICTSSQILLDIVSPRLDIQPDRLRLIPNINVFEPPTHPKQTIPKTRFLYVGRMVPSKGVVFLLGVLEELSKKFDFEMIMVGGGELLGKLQRRYAKATWVHFTGLIPATEVSNHMQDADLLLVPSLWKELCPLVIFQAIEMGLPCVASRIGGIPQLIEHGVNGDLIPPADAQAWRNVLEKILKNPDVISDWHAGVLKRKELYDHNQAGRQIVQFMEQICAAQ
ncbi:MAG: glycosyltransferase [bacterium]